MIIHMFQVQQASDNAIKASLEEFLTANPTITDVSQIDVISVLCIFHNIYYPKSGKGEMMSWNAEDLGQGCKLAKKRVASVF